MTGFPRSPLGNVEIERLEVESDLLAQQMIDEAPLLETEAPDIVTTTLLPFVHHQRLFFIF